MDTEDLNPANAVSDRVVGSSPLESHVIVGAPGSGKTTLLVERAASLVTQGLAADQILLLAPSRRQATALRDVCAYSIPVPRRGPWAQSVSAFAFAIVRAHRLQTGHEPPRLRSAADVDRDISEMLRERDRAGDGVAWPEWLSPAVRGTETFRTELRELMARLVEWGVSPERLREWAASEDRVEWAAAADFIDDYRLVIARARPHDFDPSELIGLAVSILREGIPGEFRDLSALLVDDLQDLPPSAADLVDAWSRHGVRVTATADPDSASQTFRGSTPDVAARVADRLGVEVQIMPRVYRQTPALRRVVRDVSERVGTARGGRQRRAESAVEDVGQAVWSLVSPSIEEEADTLASVCQAWHEAEGWSFEDMAIVVRSAPSIEPILRALGTHGIPAYTPHRTPLSRQVVARSLCAWMLAAVAPDQLTPQGAVGLLTDVVGDVSPSTLRRLRQSLRDLTRAEPDTPQPDTLIAEYLAGRELILNIAEELMAPLRRARDHLVWIAELAASAPVDVAVSSVWGRLGQERLWSQHAQGQGERARFADAALDSGIALVETAVRFTDSSPDLSLRSFCERVLGAEVAEDVVVPLPLTPAVWVATPAALAGVEKKVIALASVNDGAWPNTRVRGTLLGAPAIVRRAQGIDGPLDERKLVIDDEIRMAVVAASRASARLIVSAVESEESRPSPLWSLMTETAQPLRPEEHRPTPSTRVLTGRMRASLVDALSRDEDDIASQAAAALGVLARSGSAGADPATWWGLAEVSSPAPLFLDGDVTLSPSRLAHLELSPLHWFLDLIAPDPSTVSMGVGTLVHRAWERAPEGSAEDLRAEVARGWGELDFDAPWVSRQQQRVVSQWVSSLADYTRDRRSEGVTVVGVEKSFEVAVDGGRLRGIIDRIERTPSGAMLVVDLKTGVPMRVADVAEHPQLQAYQVAVLDPRVRSEWGLAEDPAEEPSEGAALLYIRGGVRGQSYRVLLQPPLNEEGARLFRARLEAAIAQVRAASFEGHFDQMARPGSPPSHRFHQVGQVSGD